MYIKTHRIDLFYIFFFLALLLGEVIITILITTFHEEHMEVWVKDYGSLFIVTATLIVVGLTLTFTHELENKKSIKELKKELKKDRLYFGTIMRSIDQRLSYYYRLLVEYRNAFPENQNITIDTGLVFYLEELDNILSDYINLLNNKDLPNTIFHIKENKITEIQNLIELQSEMYKLKPRLKSMSEQQVVDLPQYNYIINSMHNIAKDAIKIKESELSRHPIN